MNHFHLCIWWLTQKICLILTGSRRGRKGREAVNAEIYHYSNKQEDNCCCGIATKRQGSWLKGRDQLRLKASWQPPRFNKKITFKACMWRRKRNGFDFGWRLREAKNICTATNNVISWSDLYYKRNWPYLLLQKMNVPGAALVLKNKINKKTKSL